MVAYGKASTAHSVSDPRHSRSWKLRPTLTLRLVMTKFYHAMS